MSYPTTCKRTVETNIVRAFLEAVIGAGYSVSLDNGGDDYEFKNSKDIPFIMSEMFATSEETLYLSHPSCPTRFASFCYAVDGYDCLTDYTALLEPLLDKVNLLCKKYEEELYG